MTAESASTPSDSAAAPEVDLLTIYTEVAKMEALFEQGDQT